MAFHSEQQMRNALKWFETSKVFPKPALEKTFYDDNLPCYIVHFEDSFTYSFLWCENLFNIARSDIDILCAQSVLEDLVFHFEDLMVGEVYECDQIEENSLIEEFIIDSDLFDKIQAFILKNTN